MTLATVDDRAHARDMVTWTEIEAECGDYRAGFVAVFRRYEGQETDEKDARGRVVKVTANSFARHAGIPDRTFRRWLKGGKQPVHESDRARLTATEVRTVREAFKRATPEAREEIVRGLVEELPKAAVQRITSAPSSTPLLPSPSSNGNESPSSSDPSEERRRRLKALVDEIRSACRALARAADLRTECDANAVLAIEVPLIESDLKDIENYLDVVRDWFYRREVGDEVEEWLQRQQEN